MKIKLLPHFFFHLNRRIILFLFKRLSKKHSRIVDHNLALAFPELDTAERAVLKKKVYQHYSRVFLEILYLFAKRKPDMTLLKINTRNMDRLTELLDKNQGLIIFSAHFGNWELIPFILSRHFEQSIHSIARKMDNPLIEKVVGEFRAYMGSEIIYKDKAGRSILKLLEEKKILFMLVDQNTISREGVVVEFFGKRVSAVTSVAQLHLKKKIPVIPIFVQYGSDAVEIDVQEEVRFEPGPDHQENIQQLTQKYIHIIEDNIRRNPNQWFWFHNRWKSAMEYENNEKRQSDG